MRPISTSARPTASPMSVASAPSSASCTTWASCSTSRTIHAWGTCILNPQWVANGVYRILNDLTWCGRKNGCLARF